MSLLDSIEAAAKSKLSGYLGNASKSVPNLDKFKTTGTGAHNINQYMYPANLTVDDDLKHWVTFNINVRGKSKIAKDQNLAATQAPVSMNGENRLDPSKMNRGVAAEAAFGIAAGALAGKGLLGGLSLGKTLGKAAYLRGGKAGVVGAIMAAAGGAALATALTVTPDVTYRISDSISLYVSQAPNTNYTTQYDTVNMGAFGGFAAGGSMADSAGSLGSSGADLAQALGRYAMSKVGTLNSNGAARMDAASKQSLNPYREVLFKQVDFRKFEFNYMFYPQSQAETDTVQKIIETFKYHMHPELSAGGLYYIHPSEFNITYYYKGQENKYFNKISTCALVDMKVHYGDQNQFSSFKDGAPVEIAVSLTFQELETLTKERIAQGY